MSAYTVPAGHVGVYDKAAAANVEDRVTFTGADITYAEILSDGTADLWVSFGAVAATVGGTQCYRVPAGQLGATFPVTTSGDTVVRVISPGTPVYSVSRAT